MDTRYHFIASYSNDGLTSKEYTFVSCDIAQFLIESNANRAPEGGSYTFQRLLGIAHGADGNWFWQSEELKARHGD